MESLRFAQDKGKNFFTPQTKKVIKNVVRGFSLVLHDPKGSHYNCVWNLASGLELAGGFVLGAEAPRADIDFCFLSLYHNRSPLNVRHPAPGSMLLGMAYTAPKVRFFTANLALHKKYPVC
jgi:hypothetical protein